jgi:hypothetical protein
MRAIVPLRVCCGGSIQINWKIPLSVSPLQKRTSQCWRRYLPDFLRKSGVRDHCSVVEGCKESIADTKTFATCRQARDEEASVFSGLQISRQGSPRRGDHSVCVGARSIGCRSLAYKRPVVYGLKINPYKVHGLKTPCNYRDYRP